MPRQPGQPTQCDCCGQEYIRTTRRHRSRPVFCPNCDAERPVEKYHLAERDAFAQSNHLFAQFLQSLGYTEQENMRSSSPIDPKRNHYRHVWASGSVSSFYPFFPPPVFTYRGYGPTQPEPPRWEYMLALLIFLGAALIAVMTAAAQGR